MSGIWKVSSYISEKRVKERQVGHGQRQCDGSDGFDPGSEYVGFVLDEVELGRGSSE